MLPAAVTARLPRTVLAALLIALVTALGACGNKEETVTSAANEGIYVDAGEITYQVQISRQMNPADAEDRSYLVGIPRTRQTVKPDETYFGVFIRAQNETEQAARTAEQFVIRDTQEHVYRPIPQLSVNQFVYRAQVLGPTKVLPDPASVAGAGTIGGSLVLFRLPVQTLQNRPLEFVITSPEGQSATIDLDV
jgi:hypothetical protein